MQPGMPLSKEKVNNKEHGIPEIKEKPTPSQEKRDTKDTEDLSDATKEYIKGEDNTLSMWAPNKVWYQGILYETAEHAYQCRKIEHILGTNHALYDEVKEGKTANDAKRRAKMAPYSPGWQKKKKTEPENICLARMDQDPSVREALKSTRNKSLIHNVASEYWGTGETGHGQNQYGKTLEKIRLDLHKNSKDGENANENRSHLVMRRRSTTILLTDSVLKDIDPSRFRWKRQVHKQSVYITSELEEVVQAIDENSKIKEVI